MNFVGGDIIEITCKHESDTYRFQAKANEAFTIDPGGFRSNDDNNAVTGSGQPIHQINRVRWSVEGPISVDTNSENETKNLRLLAASPLDGIWTLSHINGTVWKGKGRPVGDINFDTNNAQMTLKVAGGGELEKVVV